MTDDRPATYAEVDHATRRAVTFALYEDGEFSHTFDRPLRDVPGSQPGRGDVFAVERDEDGTVADLVPLSGDDGADA